GTDLLKGGSTVQIEPGNESSRTDIQVALRMGYLTQNQQGNYSEVGTRPEVIEAQQRTAQNAAAAKVEQAKQFAPAAEAVYQEVQRIVHPGTYAAVVNTMIDEGQASVEEVHAIARQTGKTPQEVTVMLDTLQGAFNTKAAEAITKGGLAVSDAPDFDRWAQKNHKAEYFEARLLLVHGRDGSKITQLAREYL